MWGQCIGRGIRKPDPTKAKALRDHPLPKTATELRSYLGLANYLSPYIPQYSKLIAPFSTHRSLHKKTKIQLGKEHRHAMSQLREAFTKEPVLRLPDFNKRFYLQVDASKVSCGSALLQKHDDKLLPVAFHSRILTKPQKRWPIHDLELFAIIDAMKRFRSYLIDKPFTVLSDHKPLIHFMKQPELNMRQLRYLDFLAMYQFDIHYLPGKDNLFADWLSRPPGEYIRDQDVRPSFETSSCTLCSRGETDDVLDEFEVGDGIPGLPLKQVYQHTCNDKNDRRAKGTSLNITDQNRETASGGSLLGSTESQTPELATLAVHLSSLEGTEDINVDEISEAYEHDKLCSNIIDLLTNKQGHHYNRKYIFHNKVLYLKPVEGEVEYRLCIPDVSHIRDNIIKIHHDDPISGHRDCDTTYLSIRKHCFWPNMRKHVMKYVQTCPSCLKHKSIHKKPAGFLQPLEHPMAKPWHSVATDFAVHLPPSRQMVTGIVYDAIQFYVCRLSRRIRMLPCKTKDSAIDAANRYYLYIFPTEGLPKSIVSDRDPKFTSDFWRHLGRCFGIRFKMSSAHRPQTDGLSEAVVKITKMLIRIFVNYSQNNWVDYLPTFEFCLNRSRVRGRGGTDTENATPFLISKGYNPISISDIAIPQPVDASTEDYIRKKKVALAIAQDAIIAGQDRIAEIYNASRRIVQYKVGDLVLVDKNHINPPETRELRSFKLRPKWCGPYKVIQVIGSNAIRLQLPPGMQKHPVLNIESTKPYPFEALERAKTTSSTEVDGEQEWYVDAILDTKWDKRSKKRLWLVQWQGIDISLLEQGEQTWEPIEMFKSENDVYNIHIIEYEQSRTGLSDTHEYDWTYPDIPVGTVVQQQDGHTVYCTRRGDTLQRIAREHNIDAHKLLAQNVNKHRQLTTTSTIRTGTQIRFPKSAPVMALAMLAPYLIKQWK